MPSLKTITVKTQARRLRYFSVCLDFLKRSGIKKNILLSKIANWSNENEAHFQRYGAKSGFISSSKRGPISQSVKNYVEAFSKLQIIHSIDDLVLPTKLSIAMKLLKRLNKDFDNRDNSFQLSKLEKVFFLYLISKNDSSIFYTILMTIKKETEAIDLNYFRENYKEIYLKHLEDILETASSRDKIQITDAIQRAKMWRNIERYIEDIIPPRINWMYDIGILDVKKFKKDKYKLNTKGEKFISNILSITDTIVDEELLENNQFRLYSNLFDYDFTFWNEIHSEKKDTLLKKLFYFAINDFSKVKIPRLSIEQTFFFFATHLFFNFKILVEFSDLENYIGQELKIGNKRIGLRKSARKSESYIFIGDA